MPEDLRGRSGSCTENMSNIVAGAKPRSAKNKSKNLRINTGTDKQCKDKCNVLSGQQFASRAVH